MSDQAHSQTQQITDFWTKTFNEHVARVESFCTEVGKAEAKGLEKTTANLDEVARLAKESIAYSSELASAWRKLCLESMKRTLEVVAPRA